MRTRKPEEEPFEIMLIPMIDCMLVIIIFFLVATTLKNREKELPLDLPESAAALKIEQPPDLFIIGVDKEGRPYLSTGDRIEPVDTERRVRIDGDRNARFEDIIHMLDLCQFEGLTNVGLHTKTQPAQ